MPVEDIRIKEIYSRAPYDTLVRFVGNNIVRIATIRELLEAYSIDEIAEYGKLILYPITNITEQQKQQLEDIAEGRFSKIGYFRGMEKMWLDDVTRMVDLLKQWHVDYNDLIPRNMAVDANESNAYETYISDIDLK